MADALRQALALAKSPEAGFTLEQLVERVQSVQRELSLQEFVEVVRGCCCPVEALVAGAVAAPQLTTLDFSDNGCDEVAQRYINLSVATKLPKVCQAAVIMRRRARHGPATGGPQ
jgi:hypothetical protein